MLKRIAAAAALVVLFGLAMGQDAGTAGYSLAFLIDGKDANQVWGTQAFFPGRSFPETWNAVIRTLIIDHKRVLVADRPSGFISAENEFGDIQYFIEEKGGGIEVVFPSAGPQKGIEKVARKICDAILAQLPKKSG